MQRDGISFAKPMTNSATGPYLMRHDGFLVRGWSGIVAYLVDVSEELLLLFCLLPLC